MADKMLKLNSTLSIKSNLPKAGDDIDSIYIEGYASTIDVDRSRDVVPAQVWEEGLKNYLKNPIILAQHDRDDPIGRMVEHRIDSTGLWIKARISAAAEIFNLIKDGVLTAFSIGFLIKDAEYNSALDLFVIKEVELLEISVVSIPDNQNTIFSVAKAFDNAEDYANFKKQFEKSVTPPKKTEPATSTSATQKEFKMDPKDLEKLMADTAAKAAAAVTEQLAAAQREAAEKAAKEAAEKAAIESAVKAALETKIETINTGAERLLADVTKKLEDQTASAKSALEGLEASIKEKAAELDALQKSKMNFTPDSKDGITYADKEKAFLLSKFSGKSIQDTKFGKELLTKAVVGGKDPSHQASTTWETEVSLRMEEEVRRKLVIANTLRSIPMQTNVMTMPLNPEAGYGTWVTNAQFGTDASSGAAQTHQLKELTLNSYKLATREYLMYEEEEDSLIALLPIVRDAMVRRVAKSVDRAMALGAGSGADPVKGLVKYDEVSAVTDSAATPTKTASAILRALRKDLGAWGLENDQIVYLVNTEFYYDLLEDPLFQTMDKVGDKATILTGQVGAVGGTPVLVSAELPAKTAGANTGGATTNVGAIAFNAGNFIVGSQRGLRFDTQDLVETQRKVLVASLRTGMTQVTTNNGQGVSVFRWLA